MSLIKVGDQIFNLNAIETIKLGPMPTMVDDVVLNRVEIKFQSGSSLTFEDEEADTVREYLTTSRDVSDLTKPQKPLSFS